MFKKRTVNLAQVQHPANGKHREYENYELARHVYEAIDRAGLDKFTFTFIDSLCSNVSTVVHHLDHLPDDELQDFIESIQIGMKARDELRLARFLFDVQEINSVYRLLMRNRAVLRSKYLLDRILRVWPDQ